MVPGSQVGAQLPPSPRTPTLRKFQERKFNGIKSSPPPTLYRPCSLRKPTLQKERVRTLVPLGQTPTGLQDMSGRQPQGLVSASFCTLTSHFRQPPPLFRVASVWTHLGNGWVTGRTHCYTAPHGVQRGRGRPAIWVLCLRGEGPLMHPWKTHRRRH